jgi:hypothetical protein
MKLNNNEAMKRLVEAYSGREDRTDWSNVVIEPDPATDANCISYGSTFERLLTTKNLCDKAHLTQPLCALLKNLLAAPGEKGPGFGNFFVKAGARFISAYAERGETLGSSTDASEVFSLFNALLSKHDPSIGDYNVKAVTDFVRGYLDEMKPEDLRSFLSYGSMLTHKHQEDEHQDSLKKFVIYDRSQDGEFPILPMNQALLSVYIGALGRAAYCIEDVDHLPEQPFAQSLLRLSDELHRISDAGCHIPGCQLVDLHLVSQTITAISKAYSHTDDSAVRRRYEQGVSALVALTLKEPTSKLTHLGSVYAATAHTKKALVSNETPAMIDRMIQAAQNRPATGSPVIESCALRFNRQVYLELAFRASKADDLNSVEGKGRLQALADVARDGLRSKEDFSPLGKGQKLWLTMHSDDERTKMSLLETHPELHKTTFVHDLGV